MVREDEDIYLIVEPHRLDEAVRDLIRIGLDRIVGWVDPAEMTSAVETISTPEVDPTEAARQIDRGEVSILDVRRATEFAAGGLDGAQNIAHTRLASRLDELPVDRTLLVHCQGGIRSARACGYLQRLGYDVINMEGGYAAWRKAHATAHA